MALPVKTFPPKMMKRKTATGNKSPATILGRHGQEVLASDGIPPAIVRRITERRHHHPARPYHHAASTPRKKSFPYGRWALYIDIFSDFSCSFSTSAMEFSS
jgi:hypothetical protein